MIRPRMQVLAPAFAIRGARRWRLVGQVIDLPMHNDGEGRFQGPALPGRRKGWGAVAYFTSVPAALLGQCIRYRVVKEGQRCLARMAFSRLFVRFL